MEWLNGIGFTLIATLLVWAIKSVTSLSKNLGEVEKRIEDKVSDMVAREKVESIIAHRRINVFDQTVGDITEEKFSSRNIVEGKEKLPKIHHSIRRLLHEADK